MPVELSVSSASESKAPVHHRKNINDVSLKQQRLRLSSVLEAIRTLSEIEQVSEVKFVALALQAISNKSDRLQVAQVSKLMAHESYPGQFGISVRKDLYLNKSLFLLDMLEIGKRKYTQLRQLLVSSDIRFPAYQKVIDHRDNIVLRSSLLLYPNPTTKIGVSVSYSESVKHTFKRIMATISPPSHKDFPLSFQIADGLVALEVILFTISIVPIPLRSLLFYFASTQLSLKLLQALNSGKTLLLILLIVSDRFCFVLLKKIRATSDSL